MMIINKKGFIYFFMLLTSLVYLTLLTKLKFPFNMVLKPLPIFCLILLIFQENMAFNLKRLLMAALGFSALGDVTLASAITYQLETGLVFFLIAHLIYIRAFLSSPRESKIAGNFQSIFNLSIIVFSGIMLYVLFPYLGELTLAVFVYISVISFMAICALKNNPISALGAIFFMASDTLVAFEAFVFKQSNFHFAIMITYYLAQILIIQGMIRYHSKDSLPSNNELKNQVEAI